MPTENYNSKFYLNNVLFHNINKQQLSQKLLNDMSMQPIEPDRINMTEWFNFGVELDTKHTKFITYEENILLANSEELSNQIKYGKKYSVLEFFNKTRIYLGFYRLGKKINTSKTFITVYGIHHVLIELQDGVNSNTDYWMIVTRNITKFTDYTGYKDKSFSYPVSDIIKKFYFVDGALMKPDWIISNGIASMKIDASNITLEEMEMPCVLYNDYIQAADFKGHMCIKYTGVLDTYLSPQLIFFQDPDTKALLNTSKFITHRHFEVPDNKKYYVIIIHDPKIATQMDYPLYKFEKLIGDLDANKDLIPSSFLSYDDGLLEPSAIASGGYLTEIEKGFTKFPDLVKHLIEKDYKLGLYPVNLSEHSLHSDNKFIPELKPYWENFSEECYYFNFPLAGSSITLFVDGLVTVPDYIYVGYSMAYTFYKKSKIQNSRCLVWASNQIKMMESKTYTFTVDSSMKYTLPPSPKTSTFNDTSMNLITTQYKVVEEDYVNHTSRIVTGWTKTINEDDCMEFTFTPADVGKTYRIYNLDGGYFQYYRKSKYMAFELPWYLNYSESDLMMWVDGRMTHQYHIPPAVTQRILNQDVKMGINFMSDTEAGNDVYFMSTSHLDLYEKYDTITQTDGLFTLSRKDYPFSKKYMMIFINGKLIYPDDIVEISTWTFGIKGITSTNDMRIYCKVIPDEFYVYKNEFMSITTDWDTFASTITYNQWKTFTGITDITNTEDKYDIVLNDTQYLYEILYKYFIKENRGQTYKQYNLPFDNTVFDLAKDFDAIATPNGRIILDSKRDGKKARYFY